MQSLFASQLEVLMEALKYHLRFINNVEDLLTIEVWRNIIIYNRHLFGHMLM